MLIKDRSLYPLMILHFIQIYSTACSTSMNFNSPSIGLPIISKLHAVLCILGNLGVKLIKEISNCAVILAECHDFFPKWLTKFKELFSTVKLSRDTYMSGVHPGAHTPGAFLYSCNLHILAEKPYLLLKWSEKDQKAEEIKTFPGCWKPLSQSLVNLHWLLPVLVLVTRRLKYYFVELEKWINLWSSWTTGPGTVFC